MTNEQYQAIKTYLRDLIRGTSWERKVWLVGGCVRDSLMGVEVHDIDLVLQHSRGGLAFAYWLSSKKVLSGMQLFPKFCSSKVVLSQFPDQEIDISMTHRNKVNPKPGARVLVEYCTLKEDSEARDFTINTLYENLTTGKVRDYTNRGVSDLQQHLLRPASTAQQVYTSNPACMLRAIRFVTRFGWDMPAETWAELQQFAPLIQQARPSRIEKEYGKILASPYREVCEELLQQLGILEIVRQLMPPPAEKKDTRKSERKERRKSGKKPPFWLKYRKKKKETTLRNTSSLVPECVGQ